MSSSYFFLSLSFAFFSFLSLIKLMRVYSPPTLLALCIHSNQLTSVAKEKDAYLSNEEGRASCVCISIIGDIGLMEKYNLLI
jgi:hypothetical protein